MEDTTDFFLTTTNHSLTAATAGLYPRNNKSTDLFETEDNHTITQQHCEDALVFGPESYLTPSSVRNCVLSLDPPLMRRRINQYDRYECKRIRREGPNTLHQMASIIMPSIGLKKDNKATSPMLTKTSSFKLQPRVERACNSPPHLQLKFTLRDTPDFCFRRQNWNTIKSKIESDKLSCKDGSLFGNIQVNTVKAKPMKRRHSLAVMSEKMESKTLRSQMLSCKDGPLFKNTQVNTIEAKSMKRSRSLTAMSAKMDSKVLRSHMLFSKYGSLFKSIQFNAIESKPMERSYSFTAMSA